MNDVRCSAASVAVAESTVGTATAGVGWVCLEQPGAWGPKAFTSSNLDPAVGKAFEDAATAAGLRPQLIRAPGPHPATHDRPRRVIVASSRPGGTWMVAGQVTDPRRILDLDFDAVAAGRRPDWPELEPVVDPVLLVCTHARRDLCCATLGRDVARRAAAAYPGRVWESSHLSGHRFAATTALLPWGHMHGRVLDATTILAGADAGKLVGTGWRGRSTWPSGGQVAEAAIRERQGRWDIDAATVTAEGTRWRVSIDNQDWLVDVDEHADGAAPPSCGKAEEPVRRFTSHVQ